MQDSERPEETKNIQGQPSADPVSEIVVDVSKSPDVLDQPQPQNDQWSGARVDVNKIYPTPNVPSSPQQSATEAVVKKGPVLHQAKDGWYVATTIYNVMMALGAAGSLAWCAFLLIRASQDGLSVGFMVPTILSVGAAALGLFVAVKFLQRHEWARALTVLFGFLGLIGIAVSIAQSIRVAMAMLIYLPVVTSIGSLLITIAILAFLQSKPVKNQFN